MEGLVEGIQQIAVDDDGNETPIEVVQAEMKAHHDAGGLLVFATDAAVTVGLVIGVFGLPMRVVRLATQEEYTQHSPTGDECAPTAFCWVGEVAD